MTVSPFELTLYAGALLILFLTPGPVWVALIARAMSGGFQSAWPLAMGVVIGDVIWPFLAILGVTWVVGAFAGLMLVMKWVATLLFLWMGYQIIRHADHKISSDSRLTRPGMWAGFVAGVAVIMANPKAILFYIGVLPGFFDLTRLTLMDMVSIALLSAIVPLFGNLTLALAIDRAKKLLSSDTALRRLNLSAGTMLIIVGLIIPFT
jgi:threonine/homoserine/homoserine lactone efflux protein